MYVEKVVSWWEETSYKNFFFFLEFFQMSLLINWIIILNKIEHPNLLNGSIFFDNFWILKLFNFVDLQYHIALYNSLSICLICDFLFLIRKTLKRNILHLSYGRVIFLWNSPFTSVYCKCVYILLYYLSIWPRSAVNNHLISKFTCAFHNPAAYVHTFLSYACGIRTFWRTVKAEIFAGFVAFTFKRANTLQIENTKPTSREKIQHGFWSGLLQGEEGL